MCIFDHDPTNWHDLQKLVGQLFEEIGSEVFIGKHVDNVRGTKEIDVLAHDITITPQALYLCECKFLEKGSASRSGARFSDGNG